MWVWKRKERERWGECACKWLLFSTGLIYLAQMYFSASFYVSIQACVHACVCARARACVWAELISLATQLEGTLSHAEHNAGGTADRLPVAFLLHAGMIWIQTDVMVKEGRRIWYWDFLWKHAELWKRQVGWFFRHLWMVFIDFSHLQKEGIVFHNPIQDDPSQLVAV